MIKGSCLCQKISYQITGKVGDIVHCHCITCRKAHASAFSSVASVNDIDFHLAGGEFLNRFASSPGKWRYFCRHCGSQMYAKRDETSHIILRLGTLDDDPKSPELEHIWTEQKASWFQLTSTLAQHKQFE